MVLTSKMADKQALLLAYYGDDFTGSTDALEFLSRAGVKTVLFIEPPTQEKLAGYKEVQAIGVAGASRTMSPATMELELFEAFTAMKALGAAHVHYKVCSTFDSSPTIGSIGKAADIGAQVFNAAFIPLLVAAPALGRYCVFGNLFARMGIGSQGEIYRLDRHPSMSHHPITPMNEGDLRLHLAEQTTQRVELIDILTIALKEEQAREKLQEYINKGSKIILFDALHVDQLIRIGRLINEFSDANRPLFSIGSSGIEMALGEYWKESGLTRKKHTWQPVGRARSMLVVSGSCSPVTAGQIDYALSHGFVEVAISTRAIVSSSNKRIAIQYYVEQIVGLIQKGHAVITHSSLGAQDPRIEETYRALSEQGYADEEIRAKTALLYGEILGLIALEVAEKIQLQRLVIAGGDTSSFVARIMGIEAVEMIAPVSAGAPLCKAYAPESTINGIEVNFKGGQVGGKDYFITVLEGKTS